MRKKEMLNFESILKIKFYLMCFSYLIILVLLLLLLLLLLLWAIQGYNTM